MTRILTLLALVCSIGTNAFYILKDENEQKILCPKTEQGEKLRSITSDGQTVTCHYNYEPFRVVKVQPGSLRTHKRDRS